MAPGAEQRRAATGGGVRGLPARHAAMAIVSRVLDGGDTLEDAFGSSGGGAGESGLSRLDQRDRALARAIVATTLRRLPQIDAVLARFLRKPIDARACRVPAILKTAAAQILFLGMASHAVVNIATSLAAGEPSGRAMRGLTNAVLRRVAAEGPAIVARQDAAAMVLPGWLAARWQGAYGRDATRAMAELLLEEAPLDLSVRREEDAPGWAAKLGGSVPVAGTVRLARAGQVTALGGFAEGAWWVQDAAAALPVRLMGDVSGRRVIDLCAAPGGKTAQLSARGAQVTAVDRDGARMRRLGQNLDRLGLDAGQVVADALEWRPPDAADAVLLDAPCSATGIMRRHPDILRRRRAGHLAPLAALQARLLRAAADMVRPGGVVVYCTCSLEREEGEAQIDRMVAETGGLARGAIDPGLAGAFAPAITPQGDMRVLPNLLSEHGGNDGFFIAILKKMATNQLSR